MLYICQEISPFACDVCAAENVQLVWIAWPSREGECECQQRRLVGCDDAERVLIVVDAPNNMASQASPSRCWQGSAQFRPLTTCHKDTPHFRHENVEEIILNPLITFRHVPAVLDVTVVRGIGADDDHVAVQPENVTDTSETNRINMNPVVEVT